MSVVCISTKLMNDIPSTHPCFEANPRLWNLFVYFCNVLRNANPTKEAWTEENVTKWFDQLEYDYHRM